MTTARLTPGVELVTVPGRGLAVRTPDGEFLRVDTGGVAPDELVNHLTRGGEGGADSRLSPLTTAFVDAGYAVADAGGAPSPRPALAGRTVRLLGDALLTGPLARCVRELGAEVREGGPEDLEAVEAAGDPRTAVVWCLDGPVPEGLWDAADRLPARGTAWLRCHREGFHVWLEPPACRPGDVTASDVRLRRLAATPAHEELAAYWHGRRSGDSGPGHHAASAALTAALLTSDLLAWAADPDGDHFRTVCRRLRRVDLRSLDVTDHPILPVPRAIPIQRSRTRASGAEQAARPNTAEPERPAGSAPADGSEPHRRVPEAAAPPRRDSGAWSGVAAPARGRASRAADGGRPAAQEHEARRGDDR